MTTMVNNSPVVFSTGSMYQQQQQQSSLERFLSTPPQRRISRQVLFPETPETQPPTPPASDFHSPVKRNLFGTRANRKELDHFLQTSLDSLARTDLSDKYNFNFSTCQPLSGQFEWEKMDPDQLPPALARMGESRVPPAHDIDASMAALMTPIKRISLESDTSTESQSAQSCKKSKNHHRVSSINSPTPIKTESARKRRQHQNSPAASNQSQITDFMPLRKRCRVVKRKL